MTVLDRQLEYWLDAREGEHLEFKEAKNNFHFEKLVKYCAALANEGGGSIVLGVTDARPRKVVGSQAFPNLERAKAGLIERLRLRIEGREVLHPDGRVVVFTAPSHPIGVPIDVAGTYWMRAGEELAPMTPDMLRRIFDEACPDFSAEICPNATQADLDPEAVAQFRSRWWRHSRNDSLQERSQDRLLRDAELVTEGGITYAALILLGTHVALGKHLAQAEIVFEYRSSEAPGPASQREEFREGFFLFYDRLWDLVNLRNDKQHYQDGLFMRDIPTFSEGAVREATLNAVSHRDYRHAGSVFIRQFSRRIEIVSPGGFPQGITPDNILDRQQPRNRRIADIFGKCGLVERAGQGADRIFEACIREGKALPDFAHTDAYQVSLTLHGEVQDPQFVRFLERVSGAISVSFDTHDFLVLDRVHRGEPVPPALQPRLQRLTDLGVVASLGRGKGTRYLLPRRFYGMVGKPGAYSRRRGLDRETNKELLLRHLREASVTGSRMDELQQVLPSESRAQLKRLLDELRKERRVRLQGERRGARWFAVERGSVGPTGSGEPDE